MKKTQIILTVAAMLMSGICSAVSLDLVVKYPPVVIPHGDHVVFDLTKGSPAGMQTGTSYFMTCQTSAASDTAMTLETYMSSGATYFASWYGVTVPPKPEYRTTGNVQFSLPANATFTVDNMHFSNSGAAAYPISGGIFVVHNLDNQTDVTMTCSAVPVLSSIAK